MVPGVRLTLEQRGVIENGFRVGVAQAVIAVLIGVHRSTVSRERRRRVGEVIPAGDVRLRRGRQRVYSAEKAQKIAVVNGRRPKAFKVTGRLGAVVSGLLESDWSPQQIEARLPVMFSEDADLRVSHETIYRSLFVQG